MTEREIKFTEKKVDESWKEGIHRERGVGTSTSAETSRSEAKKIETSKPFLEFLSSLAYQALMHLGEMENSVAQERTIDLAAAREMIDLLRVIQQKTENNLSTEETKFLQNVLSELQLKFVNASK